MLCLRESSTYLCIYSTINGYLSCFHLWLFWTMLLWTSVHVCWCTCARISLEYLPRVEVLDLQLYWKMTIFQNKYTNIYIYIHHFECNRNSLLNLPVCKHSLLQWKLYTRTKHRIKLDVVFVKDLPSKRHLRIGPGVYA